MSTTMRRLEPGASADSVLRILPIAANLLPPEIAASRRVRGTRRVVVIALAVFAVLLGVWYGATSHQTSNARSDLNAAEDDAQRLVRQQRAFSEVVAIRAESRAIRVQLAALLASDLQWARLLTSVRNVAPKGVEVTGINSALAATASAGAGAATAGAAGDSQFPNASGEKSIGTLTVTGSGTSKVAVAAYVDALSKVPGVENPLLSDATVQNGEVQFTVRANVTRAALGGRYTPRSSKKPGEH